MAAPAEVLGVPGWPGPSSQDSLRPDTDGPTARNRGVLPLRERARRRVRRDVLGPLNARLGGALRRRLNARREFRPVFVSGAMGSGTTLLALSLWQRFDVAATIRESVLEVSPDSFLHGLEPERYGSVDRYERSLLPGAAWSPVEGRSALVRLYRSWARGGSDVVIDKGPNGNLVRAAFLAECFPEGRFVLLFRDPVVTVEGFRRKWEPFRSEPLEESVRFYRAIHERFLDAVGDFPDRVIGVRYEALVEKHEDTMARLGNFLDLWPATGSRRLESRPNAQGCGIRNVRHGRIGLVSDANRRAYGRLSRSEVRLIWDELGTLYERMGLLAE